MQFDPAGTLASILSTVMPESGMAIPMENDDLVADFDRILQQLNLEFDEHATGELPLDSKAWDQWVDQLASIAGDRSDDFLGNLQALHSHLESLLKELDASGGGNGENGIEPSGHVLLSLARTPAVGAGEEGRPDPTVPDFLAVAPPGSEGKAVPWDEGMDPQEDAGLVTAADSHSPRSPEDPADLAALAAVSIPLEQTEEGDPGPQVRPPAELPARRSPASVSTSSDGFESTVSGSGENKPDPPSLPPQQQEGRDDGGFSRLIEGDAPEPLDARSHLSPDKIVEPGRAGKGTSTATLNLGQPLDHPEWGNALGERLLWMHGKSIQVAEIRINPQHLGPVEVRVEVHDEQTSIQFTSHHAAVREAIEVALPRLREMFGSHQLQLAQVEVSGHSQPDQGHPQGGHESTSPRGNDYGGDEAGGEVSGEEVMEQRLTVRGNRLLNLYA